MRAPLGAILHYYVSLTPLAVKICSLVTIDFCYCMVIWWHWFFSY